MHLHVLKPDPDPFACLSMSSELRDSDGHDPLSLSFSSSGTSKVDEQIVLDTSPCIQCATTTVPSRSPPDKNRFASCPPVPQCSANPSPTHQPVNTVASADASVSLLSPVKDCAIPNQCVYTHPTGPSNNLIPLGLPDRSLQNVDDVHCHSPLPPMASSADSPRPAVDDGANRPVQSAYVNAGSASKATALVAVASTSVTTADYSSVVSHPEYICAICQDKASGRHYGVLSCEGCKGFFKRTVRKQTHYVCRSGGFCPVDRRKRTRCQACRYRRCIDVGMRREAVQEERQHTHRGRSATPCNTPQCTADATVFDQNMTDNEESAQPSTASACHTPSAAEAATEVDDSAKALPDVTTLKPARSQLTLTNLLVAELSTDTELSNQDTADSIYIDIGEDSVDPLVLICQSVERQLSRLLTWARQLVYFSNPFLSIDDQFCLLKSAWSELLLISAAFNSIVVNEGLLLANGRHLSRENARQHGLGPLMDRFLTELVARFRELGLERVELAFLRAIILFNPDANNLTARGRVESVRETLYAGLHSYCSTSHANDASRFTKLLLRLPPLRAIAHKCLEHLVFVKLAAEDPTSRRLINLVEHGVWPSTDPCDIATPVLGGTVNWHTAELPSDTQNSR